MSCFKTSTLVPPQADEESKHRLEPSEYTSKGATGREKNRTKGDNSYVLRERRKHVYTENHTCPDRFFTFL